MSTFGKPGDFLVDVHNWLRDADQAPHEDAAMFPLLARRFPALEPALRKLSEDHRAVARLQGEIQELVDGCVPGESDPAHLRDNLDRLAAELDAHFTYEERPSPTR
jgi:hypothetical protein